ncbi:hypothetical protein [Gloeobacter morelensis]|uniref:Transferase n=1 Tax=Gloeobacter morelensis MG652769 TaxID=2781736 RepID=A0ABY3PSU3_9CYAN|nr:hypothetical protein [Gloeobacter morelensis]UFP96584.1 hypothetical protein ISF26_10385 [Gloeobacter morelensis MG652769]
MEELQIDFGGEESVSGRPEIGPGTLIDATARLSPQSYVGNNCRIGPGVVFEGYVLVANDCTIGADAYLRDTVLSGSVRVGIQASLTGCYVAAGATIGRGAQLVNSLVRRSSIVIEPGAAVAGATPVLPKPDIR